MSPVFCTFGVKDTSYTQQTKKHSWPVQQVWFWFWSGRPDFPFTWSPHTLWWTCWTSDFEQYHCCPPHQVLNLFLLPVTETGGVYYHVQQQFVLECRACVHIGWSSCCDTSYKHSLQLLSCNITAVLSQITQIGLVYCNFQWIFTLMLLTECKHELLFSCMHGNSADSQITQNHPSALSTVCACLRVFISFDSYMLLLCDHWCSTLRHKHWHLLLPSTATKKSFLASKCLILWSCHSYCYCPLPRVTEVKLYCPLVVGRLTGGNVGDVLSNSTHTSCFLSPSCFFCLCSDIFFPCVILACVRHFRRASWLLWESQTRMHCDRSIWRKMVLGLLFLNGCKGVCKHWLFFLSIFTWWIYGFLTVGHLGKWPLDTT